MPSCACWETAKGDDQGARESFQRGGKNDLSQGPMKERSCTDVFCIPIFVFFQILFLGVSLAGLADGDPTKLYKPRDYRGSYCGTSENWNKGPDTSEVVFQSYSMNLSSVVEPAMKQALCSNVTKYALVYGSGAQSPLLDDQELRLTYLCYCCHIPCQPCAGSLQVGGELGTLEEFNATITGRMAELTTAAKAPDLFNPAGWNGDTFSTTEFWSDSRTNFQKVCVTDCSKDYRSFDDDAAKSQMRTFLFYPDRDSPLYRVWDALLASTGTNNSLTEPIIDIITKAFTFRALPETWCPYPPEKCVPMAGLEFVELSSGSQRCTFKMAKEVVDAIGEGMARAMPGIGVDAFAKSASESFGSMVGAFQATLDTFVVTAVMSFAIGLCFLVFLRFFLNFCVWAAIGSTVFLFFFGGAMLFILSSQCKGATLLESGRQRAVGVSASAVARAQSVAEGNKEAADETLEGDGANYRGVQTRTLNGRTCMEWDKQKVWPYFTSANFPNASLQKNFCRNPYYPEDVAKAKTIWCITSDMNMPWEECIPVGVMQPECPMGYSVEGSTSRKALYWSGWMMCIMGSIWLIMIHCFSKRIKLAIALNKVAARFLASHPSVLLIPSIQGLVAFLWCLAWCMSASFLLSQVPEWYVPRGYYGSYQEAFGTGSSCAFWESGEQCSGKPGMCTSSWPGGYVWKDSECVVENATPYCWRCAQPQFVFDLRFATSFFVFLWNNAFLIALGQLLIAMSVGIWWFTPEEERKKKWLVVPAFRNTFRYHIGSVMFGSFIVAVTQFARYMLKYFEKVSEGSKNRIAAYVMKVLQFVLWVFEQFIRFLNKNAYIQIALTGKNFCGSARAGYYLIMRNLLRFGLVAALGVVVGVIGFMFIVSGTIFFGYIIVRAMHSDISPFVPVVMYACIGYIMARLFMSVFAMTVSTSLQLFIVCEEMGEGTENVPEELNYVVKKCTPLNGGKMGPTKSGFGRMFTYVPSLSARE